MAFWLGLGLGLLSVFGYMCLRRWRAMNAAAFAFFLSRMESNRASSLDARLRQLARSTIEQLPPEQVQSFPEDLDLVFSGGGFKNSYSAGVGLALEAMSEAWHRGRVERIAGASAGAQVPLSHLSLLVI